MAGRRGQTLLTVYVPDEVHARLMDRAGRGKASEYVRALIERDLGDTPEPSLMDVMSEGEVVAAVAVAPRGHEQSVPLATGGIVGAAVRREAEASVALDGQTHPVRHLHRFKDTGRVLRYERGKAVPERQCECGVTAP